MRDDLRGMIERWKIKAEVFLKNNIKVFLIDIHDTYYWCDLIRVEEDTVIVLAFEGEYAGIEKKLFWVDVKKFEEYKEKGA